MMRECLFIGGPADGYRKEVEESKKHIRIAVAPYRGDRIIEAEYKRVLVLGKDNSEHFIFQFGDADPIAELIAGYTKRTAA